MPTAPGGGGALSNDRVGRFLRMMKDWGASDLHLSVGRAPMFRIDGNITEIRYRALTDGDFRTLIEPITPPALWQQYAKTGDIDCLATA
jgi:twitching motility protein PilT